MKTARERAGNATGCRINGEMHVPVDQVVDMLREHEADVRADVATRLGRLAGRVRELGKGGVAADPASIAFGLDSLVEMLRKGPVA